MDRESQGNANHSAEGCLWTELWIDTEGNRLESVEYARICTKRCCTKRCRRDEGLRERLISALVCIALSRPEGTPNPTRRV